MFGMESLSTGGFRNEIKLNKTSFTGDSPSPSLPLSLSPSPFSLPFAPLIHIPPKSPSCTIYQSNTDDALIATTNRHLPPPPPFPLPLPSLPPLIPAKTKPGTTIRLNDLRSCLVISHGFSMRCAFSGVVVVGR